MKRAIILVALLLFTATRAPAQVNDLDPRIVGTIGGVSDNVTLFPLQSRGSATIQLKGTWTGTLPIEGSLDLTCNTTTGTYATLPGTSSLTANGLTTVTVSGVRCLRLSGSGWASGTATVTMQASGAGGGGNATVSVGSVSGNAAASATGASVPAAADFTGFSSGGNLVGVSAAAPLPVVQTGALPAGSAAIGKLAANSGVDIGDVDVTSSALPTGAATSANQASEVASLGLIDNLPNTQGSATGGQSGVLGLCAVTTAAPSYTTGQSSPCSVDLTGAVRVVGSSGTTQYAEDIPSVSGDSVVMMGAIRRDTTPTSSSGTAGDVSIPTLDGTGRLYTNDSAYTPNGDSAMDETANAMKAIFVDAAGVTITPDTQATHDTGLGTITNVTGGESFCRASAAAPTDVSADNDGALFWCLRSGALAFQPTYAGILASTGVGAAGTGTPRFVDVASGSTGSAPPAQASYVGGVTSGATGGLLSGGVTVCDSQAFLDMTSATTTELVALTASRKVYICYWLAVSNGATTMTFKRGTSTNCQTGTTTISNAWELTAQVGFSGGGGFGAIFDNQNAGDALCVTNSAAVNLHIFVRYAKY